MISSFHAEMYRALRDCEIPDLRPINLFVGPNGSGKSSILQAGFLFCIDANASKLTSVVAADTDSLDYEELRRAIDKTFFTDTGSLQNSEFAIRGVVDGEARRVTVHRWENEFQAEAQESQEESSEPGPTNGTRSGAPLDLQHVKETATLRYTLETEQRDLKSIGTLYLSPAHPAVSDVPPRQLRLPARITRADSRRRRAVAKLWDRAQMEDRTQAIEELLRQIDPRLEGLRIGVASDDSPVLRAKHKTLGLCPLSLLGDGFSDALHFALQISPKEPEHIFYDEFDASMHITALRHLASFSKKVAEDGNQLFLTTHRSDTVHAFADLIRDGWDGVAVYQTKLVDNAVSIRRFSGEQILAALDELHLDIRVPS